MLTTHERRTVMLSHPSLSKIQSDHLDRDALIYVRQSSLMQVRDNTASTMRQYDLVQRALSLGWTRERIHVIDQDQGHSGSSTIGRDGFQALVAEVGLKHCGAVLSLEVSRLARSCSDWYQLLEICALTHTLVIDEEGIYDPGAYNDRLLLGFKGTMSEAELHWLRSRLQGGKLTKAEQSRGNFDFACLSVCSTIQWGVPFWIPMRQYRKRFALPLPSLNTMAQLWLWSVTLLSTICVFPSDTGEVLVLAN